MSGSTSITSRLPLRRASSATANPGPVPERHVVPYGFERRRSSIARSAASFQKKLGTTFRYGRDKNDARNDGTSVKEENTTSLHDRFLSLPNELHVQILCALSFPDILSLRLTSRSFHRLIKISEAPVVRHYTRNILGTASLTLYPAPPPKEARLKYLLNLHRCGIVSSKLAWRITDFLMVEILLQDSERRRRNSRALEERLTKRITPLIFVLNHFFDESRERLFEQRCEIGVVGLIPALMMGGCTHSKANCSCVRELAAEFWTVNQNDIVAKYDKNGLLDYHRMFLLLVSAFARQLRPPTYATRFERVLRGQSRPPAKVEDIASVFVLGGLQQVQKILAHRAYADRRKALDVFITGLSPAESVRWRENWASILGKGSSDFTREQVNYAMKCVPEMQHIWGRTAEQLLLSRGTIADIGEIKSVGDFISDLVGYDVVHGTRLVMQDGSARHVDGDENEDGRGAGERADDAGEGEEGLQVGSNSAALGTNLIGRLSLPGLEGVRTGRTSYESRKLASLDTR